MPLEPDTFITALRQLESDGSPDALVDLYADDSVSDNLTHTDGLNGPDGAREFWTADRALFESISSDFRNVVAQDGVIVLEWTRSGTTADGETVEYDGVSLLEHADGAITRFRGYADPAAVRRHLG